MLYHSAVVEVRDQSTELAGRRKIPQSVCPLEKLLLLRFEWTPEYLKLSISPDLPHAGLTTLPRSFATAREHEKYPGGALYRRPVHSPSDCPVVGPDRGWSTMLLEQQFKKLPPGH